MADETDVQDAPAADAGAAFEAQQAAANEAALAPTIEEIAREMGWSDKDKWRGDPDDWTDAATFLRSSAVVNKKLRAEIKDIKRSIDKTARAMAEEKFATMKAELEAKLDEAVEVGDKKAAKQIGVELARLDAKQSGAADDDGDLVEQFKADNSWWETDPEATALAVGVSARLAGEGKSVAEQLKAAEAAVRKRFPEHFEVQARRKPPAAVHEPGSRGAGQRSGGTGWNDLPADVQQQMERHFVRTGMVTDKALLAKNWFAENKGN